MAFGEFLVVYDAEDRPSSNQLREAYTRFRLGHEKTVCYQAPLLINNWSQNWLTRMFALEYLTLFRGILPVMAKWQVPLPLGGTSNHFNTEVLREVLAWDPYNVTEDADLGMRLARYGHLCETLHSPTYEEAPPSFIPWVCQRSRWLKGWIQTVLVHNRNPIAVLRELGFKNFLAFQMFMTVLVFSVLIYPFFVALFLYHLVMTPIPPPGWDLLFLGVNVFVLVDGFVSHIILAALVLVDTGYKHLVWMLLLMPVYWLLISAAGWMAIIELLRNPFLWRKTPHGLAK